MADDTIRSDEEDVEAHGPRELGPREPAHVSSMQSAKRAKTTSRTSRPTGLGSSAHVSSALASSARREL